MEIALAIMISFFIVLLSTPSFIKVANIKHLFDDPNESRKLHKKSIPSIVFALLLQFPPFRNSDLGSHIRHFCPPPEASWSVKS